MNGMNASLVRSVLRCVLFVAVATSLGCEAEPPAKSEPKATPPPAATESKKAQIGKNVWLETIGDKRRVLVSAYVCLREGQLEHLMCRKQTKEHEAILAADCDARHIHAALEAARAMPGSTVKFQPKYQPPTGTRIKISLRYEENGREVIVPAQKWIRNANTRKDLDQDWVFAGSHLIPDRFEPNKPPYYLANDGDVICVSNFEGALLDLPINSPKDNSELVFEANTDRIPPKDTVVVVILEPVLEKKK
jgi:hypothetical protein